MGNEESPPPFPSPPIPPPAPSGSPRDWHPALMLFTTYGTALVYSLPVLRLCCIVKGFVDPSDIR